MSRTVDVRSGQPRKKKRKPNAKEHHNAVWKKLEDRDPQDTNVYNVVLGVGYQFEHHLDLVLYEVY